MDRVKIQQLPTGVSGLDEILGGGLPEYSFNIIAGAPGCGKTTLIAGPSGAGKSVLGSQFIAEGLRHGEPGIVAIFEEIPSEYVERAAKLGFDFDTPQKDGTLKILYLRPLDLSVDETVHEIVNAVRQIGCNPIDYRFLETNPAFEKQSGLHEATGKRIRELSPHHENLWFEKYGKVALTGESIRFINQAQELGGRWFDV